MFTVKLNKPMMINGILCAKYTGGCGCSGGQAEVAFYESGKIRYLYPAKSCMVNGYKCSAFRQIYYYENGNVQRLWLIKPQLIDNMKLKGFVYFYKNGKVRMGRISSSCKREGIKWPSGTLMMFHENGKIAGVKLGSSLKINDKRYSKSSILEFSDNFKNVKDRDLDWQNEWY